MKLSDLLTHSAIAIQCHNIPDADALASGFALFKYFESAGKQPLFFYGGPPVTKPNLTGMIDSLKIPVRHAPDLRDWDGLLITVDCQYGAGNVARVSASHVAVIDHHIQEKELPALCDLRPWLGSCATLVWDLLRKESFTPDDSLATALHYGLFTDTNGFSEVRHPLDRDMWDALAINESIVKRLKLSNLSLTDLSQVSTALNHLAYDKELHCALIPAPPCDPNILGFISDMSMQVDTVDLAVAYSPLPNGDVKFSVRTSVRETKASELAAWLANGLGSGGGHREKAGGYIAGSKYQECFGEKPVHAYCKESIREYYGAFRIVDCANPATIRDWPDMGAMSSYRKLPVRQGFAYCADLFPNGCELQLRMLEGDMDVQADENTVLMIGIMGEAYLMNRDTFSMKYRVVDEAYEPAQSLFYEPTALNKNTGKRIPLLEHARTCISTGTDTVKAQRLDERVKVFTRWDQDNYFSGNPGDWIVASSPEDLYIVTGAVFDQIYALDLTGEDVSSLPGARLVVKQDIPVRVVFADKAGTLDTLEGKVNYERGDALMTGLEGENWPVSRDSFDRRYVPEAAVEQGQNGTYRPVAEPVWAAQIHEAFTVILSDEKGSLLGRAGDWLVQYGVGEYGIVDREIFTSRYFDQKV
ncbi:DHH family phosphoesterase [Desulfovibrio sp. OttesenSCG-928-M14]|nr:DHH family phosphoesterase [Desulfovibrio sp. OttesenSCG-928-M14]